MSTVIGFLAACCSTVAFLPQVLKAWRTRSTSDVSLATYGVIALGAVLWISYGILDQDMPVLITNGVILVLAVIIIGLKLRYG